MFKRTYLVVCNGVTCRACEKCETAILTAQKVCRLNNAACYVDEYNHWTEKRTRIYRVDGFETTPIISENL